MVEFSRRQVNIVAHELLRVAIYIVSFHEMRLSLILHGTFFFCSNLRKCFDMSFTQLVILYIKRDVLSIQILEVNIKSIGLEDCKVRFGSL